MRVKWVNRITESCARARCHSTTTTHCSPTCGGCPRRTSPWSFGPRPRRTMKAIRRSRQQGRRSSATSSPMRRTSQTRPSLSVSSPHLPVFFLLFFLVLFLGRRKAGQQVFRNFFSHTTHLPDASKPFLLIAFTCSLAWLLSSRPDPPPRRVQSRSVSSPNLFLSPGSFQNAYISCNVISRSLKLL
jgi:hypothetical protein